MNVLAFLILLAIATVLVVVVMSAGDQRPGANQTTTRRCPTCGAEQPKHARFCRRCGLGL
jgi:predicted amidophosphoribosyltransferase